MKQKLVTVITMVVISSIAVIFILPYLHTGLNQKEVTLTVGFDIKDNIRPNTPITIEMDNSYQAKIQITSPHEIDFDYAGTTTESSYAYGDGNVSRQTIDIKLPIVEGEMTIDHLPNNAEIKLISDNQYFTVTYYKPLGKHGVNLIIDGLRFSLIVCVIFLIKWEISRHQKN